MKECYGYLFEIENILKNSIRSHLYNLYGENWILIIRKKYNNRISNKDLENMNFHELISFIKMPSELKGFYKEDILKSLTRVAIVRNKIAHCKIINRNEYKEIYQIYEKLKNKN